MRNRDLYFCANLVFVLDLFKRTLIGKYIIYRTIDIPFGDKYIGASLTMAWKQGQKRIKLLREFSNINREAIEATKPQAASYASTPLPRPASQAGDNSKSRKELKQ